MGALTIYAKIVREKYTYIIITTLVVAVVAGFFQRRAWDFHSPF